MVLIKEIVLGRLKEFSEMELMVIFKAISREKKDDFICKLREERDEEEDAV